MWMSAGGSGYSLILKLLVMDDDVNDDEGINAAEPLKIEIYHSMIITAVNKMLVIVINAVFNIYTEKI